MLWKQSQKILGTAEIIRSRLADYSQLRDCISIEECIGWSRSAGIRMFNGNVVKARIVQALAQEGGCSLFVETGTSHAATTIGALRLLGVPVWSCENSLIDFSISWVMTFGIRSIQLFRKDSRSFLTSIAKQHERAQSTMIFYLDAHEGRRDPDSFPLPDELKVITALKSFVVVIDDFQVPHDDGFKYGFYGEMSLDLKSIRKVLQRSGIRRVYLPGYRASDETGFPTGFCVFWRSERLDRAVRAGGFPFCILSPVDV